MYERMLDKNIIPTFEDLVDYAKDSGRIWIQLDEWIKEQYKASTQIRFPYGKTYGWSVKYSKGSKHICDIFAEKEAFCVFLKMSDKGYEIIKEELSKEAKQVYAEKYPCTGGGWITFRITKESQLKDAKKFIEAKVKY